MPGPASSNHESIDNGDTFDRQTTGIGQSIPGVILNLPELAEIQNPKPSFHVRSYLEFPPPGSRSGEGDAATAT